MYKIRRQSFEEAKNILNALSITLRVAHTYGVSNDAFVRVSDGALVAVKKILDSEQILRIELLGDHFYVNNAMVRYSVQHYLNFDYLMTEMKKREIGSIVIEPSIKAADIQQFMSVFITCITEDFPLAALQVALQTVDSIDVGPLKEIRQDGLSDLKKTAKKNYYNAVANIKSISKKAAEHDSIEVKKVRMAVNSLIDSMLEEDQMLISMTAIKDYDDYTYYHSVNVSILSIALGMRLGLNRRRLSELGIAAFLHDIGKVRIPHNILNKVSPFTPDEWKLVQMHPMEGVRTIMDSMKIDQVSIRGAIAAFEHHLNFDCTGYPQVPSGYILDLYSNIITITDRFDAMTSARVYERAAKPPDVAIEIMSKLAGTHLNPTLLSLFIKMVGIYPVGTLVMLDTREMGIVCRNNPDIPDRPLVKIVVDSAGKRRDEEEIVDLSQRDSEGRFIRSVRSAIDSNRYKLNIADYLIESIT